MKHPQEVEVWYVILAIRREMAAGMRRHGLKNKEIAKVLDVSDAAVFQYSKSKRGCAVVFPDEVKERIGCAAASFETLEDGAVAHGLDTDKLVRDLNRKAKG